MLLKLPDFFIQQRCVNLSVLILTLIICFLYSIDTRRFESGATTVLIESRWFVELIKLQLVAIT